MQVANFGLPEDDDPTKNPGNPESRWRAMLQAYEYTWTDEFDLVLMDAVKKGYFDERRLEAEARRQSAKFAKGRREGSFEAAWRKFHDLFAADQEEVLDGIYGAFVKNIEYVTPVKLNGTVAKSSRSSVGPSRPWK